MQHSTVFVLFVVSIVTLAAVNAVAHVFSLYWVYSWFDIPMHAFGGLVSAFGYAAARERWPTLPAGFLPTMAAVLAVGLAWEIFEHLFRAAGGPFDTAKDLVMDLAGGVIGYRAARRIATLE